MRNKWPYIIRTQMKKCIVEKRESITTSLNYVYLFYNYELTDGGELKITLQNRKKSSKRRNIKSEYIIEIDPNKAPNSSYTAAARRAWAGT